MSNRFHFIIKCDREEKGKSCSHNYKGHGPDFHSRYWKYVERFLPIKGNNEGNIKKNMSHQQSVTSTVGYSIKGTR